MYEKLNKCTIFFAILIMLSLMLGTTYASIDNKFNHKSIEAFTVKGVFQQADADKVKVNSWMINIRSGASEQHNIVKVAYRNEILTVLGKINNWYVIKTNNDLVGCVNSKYVSLVSGTEPPEPEPKQPKPTPEPDKQQKERTDKDIVIKNPEPKPTLSKLEQQQLEMVGYINQARKKKGKTPLKLDDSLSEVAQAKSQDMVDNNYFSHNSPTYGSPFDMMTEFGVSYGWAGENLAKNSSLKSAHESLMESPGHKRNILQRNFNKVGIGVVKKGPLLYITEMFTD
ncbi:MAG: hypothetical protein FH758_03275 [Firmicutes bacterium]|nr:hypothetical protein [Bacillota bacterium]